MPITPTPVPYRDYQAEVDDDVYPNNDMYIEERILRNNYGKTKMSWIQRMDENAEEYNKSGAYEWEEWEMNPVMKAIHDNCNRESDRIRRGIAKLNRQYVKDMDPYNHPWNHPEHINYQINLNHKPDGYWNLIYSPIIQEIMKLNPNPPMA
jgi:thymidylate synthase